MSQWFFLMEPLSELDGGLAGRLGATLHTTGPCVLGEHRVIWLRGRRDLKGVWSRSLVGQAIEFISMGLMWWLSFLWFLAKLDVR